MGSFNDLPFLPCQTYYGRVINQSGIGTYTIPQVASPLYSAYSKTMDLMFASNLNYHVMSGYKFLMDNCECNFAAFLLELRAELALSRQGW
jgi:uncharacterized protein (DUF2235 family)